VAQVNEVLLKVLCHNICVVIHEMFELGIELKLLTCVSALEYLFGNRKYFVQ
jgi:hypothetical protein